MAAKRAQRGYRSVAGYGAGGRFSSFVEYSDGTFEHFSNPFRYFQIINKLKKLLSRSRPASEAMAELQAEAERGVSQDQYFEEMATGIDALTEQLLIYGYDSTFMQDSRIHKAITDAANRY